MADMRQMRFALIIAMAALVLVGLRQAAYAQAVDIERSTAADLELSAQTGEKAFIEYVNRVKIPQVAQTDQALANALKIYFNQIVPGNAHETLGEMDFDNVMIKVEEYSSGQNIRCLNFQPRKLQIRHLLSARRPNSNAWRVCRKRSRFLRLDYLSLITGSRVLDARLATHLMNVHTNDQIGFVEMCGSAARL
jgi:hypothetical protein